MSSIKKEEEPSPSNNLIITIEVMTKQFERLGNLFQQNTDRLERFEVRMIELERRQHPRQYPRRQDRRRNNGDEYKDVSGDDFEDEEPIIFTTFGGKARRNIRSNEDRVDSNVGSIKMKIPHF